MRNLRSITIGRHIRGYFNLPGQDNIPAWEHLVEEKFSN